MAVSLMQPDSMDICRQAAHASPCNMSSSEHNNCAEHQLQTFRSRAYPWVTCHLHISQVIFWTGVPSTVKMGTVTPSASWDLWQMEGNNSQVLDKGLLSPSHSAYHQLLHPQLLATTDNLESLTQSRDKMVISSHIYFKFFILCWV